MQMCLFPLIADGGNSNSLSHSSFYLSFMQNKMSLVYQQSAEAEMCLRWSLVVLLYLLLSEAFFNDPCCLLKHQGFNKTAWLQRLISAFSVCCDPERTLFICGTENFR